MGGIYAKLGELRRIVRQFDYLSDETSVWVKEAE